MIFASPAIAWAALGATTIPILLHLLLRRPKLTPWGSNYLLKIALARIQRRRRIERWLLLLLRALAVGLVGLAVAGPFARAWMQESVAKERWIVIDDGATSAEIRPGGESELSILKKAVTDSLRGRSTGDRFAVVLASIPPRVLVEPTSNPEVAAQAIASLSPQEVPANLSAALELAWPKEEDKNHPRQVEVWSGFRRGSLDLEQPPPAGLSGRGEQVKWMATRPLQDNPANQSLWKCSMARSASEVDEANRRVVRVELKREGAARAESNTVLFQNPQNETVAKSDALWNEGATEKEFEVQVQLGQRSEQGIQASIQADAQPMDNRRYVSFEAAENFQVTILGRKSLEQNIENLPASSWILRAIESTGMAVQETDAETISIRPPAASDTIILTRPDLVDQAGWTWLGSFTMGGGVLIITPAAESSEQGWAADIERLLQVPIRSQKSATTGDFRLAAKQPRGGPLAILGAELDALSEPVHVTKYLPLETTDAAALSILVLDNGKPLMCWAKPRNGSGIVAILGVPPVLSWSDLPMKPLMVPLFQELVRGGRMIAAEQQDMESGSAVSLGSAAAGGLFVPPAQSGAATIELDMNGQSQKRTSVTGLWTLQTKSGRKQTYAVNLAPTAASISPLSDSAVRAWFGQVKPIQFSDEAQEELAPATWSAADPAVSETLFILALLCALIECFLSKRGSPRPAHQETIVGAGA
ncbi:MAG: BatA and WFA domain-containing protein [Planctomycetes bacterium]|nr:BatA and WFA domain-containing protein [Planctomycetota bacterium]